MPATACGAHYIRCISEVLDVITLDGEDMPAYIIAEVDVTDPAGFEEYRAPKALRIKTTRSRLIPV